MFILNNTYNVDDDWFRLSRTQHIHKMSMNRARTLKDSLPGRLGVCFTCCFFFANGLFFFFCKCNNQVRLYHVWWRIPVARIFLTLWIWISRLMNQIYFEWYEFEANVVSVVIAICTYKSTLVVVSTNESESIIKFQYCCLEKLGQ